MAEPAEPPSLIRFPQYPYAVISVPVQEILAVFSITRAPVPGGQKGQTADDALEVL